MSDTPVRRSPIPEFQSREEEAEWWDTHDLSEFWDDLGPADVTVYPSVLSERSMSVRLPSRTLDQLRREASRKGVGHTTLARMWIMERLEAEEQSNASNNQ